MCRLLVVILAGVFAISTAKISTCDLDAWQRFKVEYSKQYANEAEEERRMSIFVKHKREIDKHNELYENGFASFKMAINRFSDLNPDEFSNQVNGLKSRDVLRSQTNDEDRDYFVGSVHMNLPKSIDWRKKGAVSRRVRKQMDCGSCWAIAAVEAIEGQLYIHKHGPIRELSPQNLVDCATLYATLLKEQYLNFGCEGGVVDEAFRYVKEHGIDTEKAYPYVAKDKTCKYTKQKSNITISGFKDIPTGDEQKLQQALATVGPVVVAIDASLPSFQHYASGVYNDRNCSSVYNHAVLAVGFGVEKDGHEYYIVKNSWGPNWGEDGYVKMSRNKNNQCAIASNAQYPVV